MKKFLAALMAIALALSMLAALAEENASIIRMSNMKLSYVSESGTGSADFHNATLLIALGNPEGAPTLQMMFDSGEGQAVDAVMQIVGNQVLFSMGGLSATYAVSLDRFAVGLNTGEDVGKGVSQALAIAGSHLDVLLYAVTTEGEDGMRSVEAPVPMPQLLQVVQAMLSLANGAETSEDVDLEELRARVDSLGGETRLGFRYNPETGAFDLAAVQDGKGMQLSGIFSISYEPMNFLDITTEDVEICDLMNLTDAQREDLQGELSMLFPKFRDFAGSTGMDGFAP